MKPTYSQFKIQANELQDETNLVNLGQYTMSYFKTVEKMFYKGFESIKSTQDTYPANYKFKGLVFRASNTGTSTDRETYDMLSAIGDSGGFNEILTMFLGLIAARFALINEQATMT